MLDEVICGDCLEVMPQIPSESIDLILTDPPYGIDKGKVFGDKDLQAWINSLSDSQRVLKEGGFYLTYCSIAKLPDVMWAATDYFNYRWTSIFYINNGMVRGSVGFSCYYPLLIFMKGKAAVKKPLRDVMEVSTSKEEMKRRIHPYQKDIRFIAKHIEAFSKSGDIVLDPFAGSFQTALAARQMGRHFIGIEKDPKYCDIARQRLASLPTNLANFSEVTCSP